MSVPMSSQTKVPPGFRFRPTDEELVDYYLKKKVESQRIDLDVIREIDLYKIEPWDLQERCRIGSTDQDDWYFFSHKDKKYPTGTRTNRATAAGFWKATGRDKAIYSKHKLVGMRKTLVFYRGRAPNGQKTDWIMHEYRLENCENGCTTQTSEEGWAVCRVFKKRNPNIKMLLHERDPMGGCYFDDPMSFLADGLDSPKHAENNIMGELMNQERETMYHFFNHGPAGHHHNFGVFSCKQELDQLADYHLSHDPFMQLPHLESPKVTAPCFNTNNTAPHFNALSSSNVSHVRALMQLENHAAAAAMIRSGQNLINPLCALAENASLNIDFGVSPLSMGGAHNGNTAAAAVPNPLVLGSKEEQAVTDWRVLDRLVASQLSQDGIPTEIRFTSDHSIVANEQSLINSEEQQQQAVNASAPNTASTPNYNLCNDVDLWNFAKRNLGTKPFPQI